VQYRLLALTAALALTGCPNPSKDVPAETGEVDTGTDSPADTGALEDADQDGFSAQVDCDDLDAATYPGAPETCDELDNDCDGEIDENVTSTWFLDADGDGYGTADVTTDECVAGTGFTDNADDCNDLNDDIHPDALETCDGIDNNCDGRSDEPDATDASTWYVDSDGDGWGTSDATEIGCDAPAGFVLHDGDCDDANPSYHPGASEADCTDPNDYNCDGSVGYVDADGDGFSACEDCDDNEATTHENGTEVCDGADNDCDGDVDDDAVDATTWYGDSDGDGHGGTQFQVEACDAPVNYVATADDCDDLDASSYPGASEVCDLADNDCDTIVDEGVEFTFYADADADGYGDASQPIEACVQPARHSSNGDDCDDSSASTSPASYEVCDGVDNDCDLAVDEADAINTSTWYLDTDSDGYGDSLQATSACDMPSGYANNGSDCDDDSASIHPAATEICDSLDNDCDGDADESDAADASTWYPDADGDSYGDATSPQVSCSQPIGTLADGQDCDDSNGNIHPGATEVCDGVDNDCSGDADGTDATDATTWYLDADGDGAGTSDTTVLACTQPTGYAATDGDCDDNDTSAVLCVDGTACSDHSDCVSGLCGAVSGTCVTMSEIVISGLLAEHNGDMGGIAGANALCAADAATSGQTGAWVAFLSDSTQDIIDLIPDTQNSSGDRLRASLPVQDIQGGALLSSWDTLADGSAANTSNMVRAFSGDPMDEPYGYTNDADAWTGSQPGATVYTTEHCSNWSTTDGTGVATELDGMSLFRQETGHACSQTLGVMCVRVEP